MGNHARRFFIAQIQNEFKISPISVFMNLLSALAFEHQVHAKCRLFALFISEIAGIFIHAFNAHF
jgi:hypothetical protein